MRLTTGPGRRKTIVGRRVGKVWRTPHGRQGDRPALARIAKSADCVSASSYSNAQCFPAGARQRRVDRQALQRDPGGNMKTWSLFCRRSAALAALTLAGCVAAPPQRWGEWIDPTLGPSSGILRGGQVLIACDTFDLLWRQPCQDDLSRALAGRGANPVVAPGAMTPGALESEAQLAASATAIGAHTVFVLSLAPAATSAPIASGMSVGIGGFSWGRSGGAGIGLSAPIGGGWGTTGFSATARVINVSTGRLVWSTSFAASPSSDIGGQVRELTRNVLDSAQAAGLL